MYERHGEAKVPQTLEYRSWAGMIQRCNNPKNPMYSYYGERGIKVCEKWLNSYPAFLEDMGRRPTSKHSLDRIDNLLDYSPENCIWNTVDGQARNKRVTKLTVEKVVKIRKLFSNGERQKDIAEKFGVSLNIIHKVVKNITWKNI